MFLVSTVHVVPQEDLLDDLRGMDASSNRSIHQSSLTSLQRHPLLQFWPVAAAIYLLFVFSIDGAMYRIALFSLMNVIHLSALLLVIALRSHRSTSGLIL